MAVDVDRNLSSDLFKNADGSSLIFFMRPCNERQELRPHIEAGGGKVTSKVLKGSIKLAERGALVSSDDYILAGFVTDCVKENKLLPMDKYRVTSGTRVRSASGDSDNSIRSFSSNDSLSPAPYIIQTTSTRNFKGRTKYTKEEDIAMITFLIEERRHMEALGIRVWKDMELRKVTNHSATSMNTRYRKHILPNIESYKYDVDRRWLSKLTGGVVVKETEPEFSADALFTLRKKRVKPEETDSTEKNHLTGGTGDIYDFVSGETSGHGEPDEKQIDKSVDIQEMGTVKKMFVDAEEFERDKGASDTGQRWKKKNVEGNYRQNKKELTTDEESSKEPAESGNSSQTEKNIAEKRGTDKRSSHKCEKQNTDKPLAKSEIDTSANSENEIEPINVDELESISRSSSDIFEIPDESSEEIPKKGDKNDATECDSDIVETDDGRLTLSQEASDGRNLDDPEYAKTDHEKDKSDVNVKEKDKSEEEILNFVKEKPKSKEGNPKDRAIGDKEKPKSKEGNPKDRAIGDKEKSKDETDKTMGEKAKPKAKKEKHITTEIHEDENVAYDSNDNNETPPNTQVQIVGSGSKVSDNADTQPPPQSNEICSNEVTSSGQCELEFSLDVQIHQSDSDEDDSFDEMLKKHMKKSKVNVVNLDTEDSDANEVTVIHVDNNTSEKGKQTESWHNRTRHSKKRKDMSEELEISSVRCEKKRKLVEGCRATCQGIAEEYDISQGFVSQVLFQCSGDVNRTVTYIEYGPLSPDLPPWTELDDKVLEKDPKAAGLIRKFGWADVFKRYNFMHYVK